MTRLSLRARLVVVSVALVVGVGALFGGWGLLSDAEGLGARQSWLQGSPFPNYIVPGLVLLVVVGGGMLATAAAALIGSRLAGQASFAMGAVLLVWGTVETATIGYRGVGQLVMLALFVGVPAVTLLKIGWRTSREEARRHGQ